MIENVDDIESIEQMDDVDDIIGGRSEDDQAKQLLQHHASAKLI